MTEYEQERMQDHYRRWLDAPLEECSEMERGSSRAALILAAAALAAFAGTWGLLALITWAVS